MPKVPLSDESLLLSGISYQDDCWLRIKGARPGGGYSRVSRRGRTIYAHRLAYEIWVGPIPSGKQIDHLCERRSCINPAHLRPSTPSQNQSHGKTNAAKTACPKGHPYDDTNTIITAQGSRLCRTCYRRPRQPKSDCVHGHRMDEENTYVYRGHRICRTCRARIMRENYRRRKARSR